MICHFVKCHLSVRTLARTCSMMSSTAGTDRRPCHTCGDRLWNLSDHSQVFRLRWNTCWQQTNFILRCTPSAHEKREPLLATLWCIRCLIANGKRFRPRPFSCIAYGKGSGHGKVTSTQGLTNQGQTNITVTSESPRSEVHAQQAVQHTEKKLELRSG